MCTTQTNNGKLNAVQLLVQLSIVNGISFFFMFSLHYIYIPFSNHWSIYNPFLFLWYADVQQIDPLVHPFIVVEEGQTVEEAVREQSVPSDIDILEDLILEPGWEADQGNVNEEQDSDPDVSEKEKQSSRLFLYQK